MIFLVNLLVHPFLGILIGTQAGLGNTVELGAAG